MSVCSIVSELCFYGCCHLCLCVYVCVCLCLGERKREREEREMVRFYFCNLQNKSKTLSFQMKSFVHCFYVYNIFLCKSKMMSLCIEGYR